MNKLDAVEDLLAMPLIVIQQAEQYGSVLDDHHMYLPAQELEIPVEES